MEILRNMWRRKFRTFLTIFGIVIGIFAFTVMGSMALKLNKMIDGGKQYMTGQISILPKGSTGAESMGGSAATNMIPKATLDKIAKVKGVDQVGSSVSLPLEEQNADSGVSFSMGPPPTIYGMDFTSGFKNKNWQTMDMQEGHMLTKEDGNDSVAIGINIATDKGLKVGDTMNIRGHDFKVVGIVAKTLTGPDEYVFMSNESARNLLIEATPFLKALKEQSDQAQQISDAALAQMPEATRQQILNAKAFKVEDINTMAGVTWKDGQDSEVVANRIKDQFKDEVTVLSPVKMGEQIDKASSIFNAIILGVALIALIVGGFSIINTMVMSISERTKEIGIKKALGASGKSIAWEYTLEAGLIGLLGGLVGMGLGVLTAVLINHRMAEKGAEIFLIEPSFLIEVVVFSFGLGIIAGLIPAIRAAKMRAVNAIREL